MKPYVLFVAHEVNEFTDGLPRRELLTIRKQMRHLRDYPGNCSDYTEFDDIGRRIEINVCGKFALKYWIDEADRHVKIFEVFLAEPKR